MVVPDYSLNAAPRAVGRSMNDPQRMQQIAMRRLRSQGNFQDAAALAQNQAWLDARLGGGRSPMMMPAMPPAPNQAPTLPAMPAIPGGRLVPGRSGGSMVWQPDAPPTRSMPSAPASSPAAMPSLPMPSMSPPAMPAATMPIVPPQLEGNNPLTGLPLPSLNSPSMMPEGWNAMNRGNAAAGLPLPPTGLYGPESPPMISSAPIPGTDQMMPMIGGVPKGTPVAKTQPKPAAEWQPPKMYDETIPEKRDAKGNVISAATTRQYYYVQDPKTGKPRKEYALDANGDGVPDNQQPGWMSWLEAQK